MKKPAEPAAFTLPAWAACKTLTQRLLSVGLLGVGLLSSAAVLAQTPTSQPPANDPANDIATKPETAARPAFKPLRYDEDWSALRDPQQRRAALDALKYIPLGRHANWYVSLGGEIRPYYENFQNEDWGAEPTDTNGFLLQRYMLHADVHLGAHLRFFGQLKSGLEVGRKGGPRPTDEDKLDVHQGFVEVAGRLGEAATWQLRIGRQELSFGSGRLVSTREGPNVRQSFDGARLTWRTKQWTVDGFATKPAQTRPGFYDDAANAAQSFWGVYVTRPLARLPHHGHVDLYYFGLDKRSARFAQGAGRERRQTLGTRWWNARAPLTYNLEFVYQFGQFDAARNADIRAWTVASDLGYRWQAASWQPRLGLRSNVTSGDSDPTDAKLGTFNPLFPKGAYFGQLSPVGPRNHRDLHPNLELTFPREITLTLDWVFYWRHSLRDAVYDIPGNLQRSGQHSRARFIGQQPGLELNWPLDHHTTISFSYAHFLVGRFLQETPPGQNIRYLAGWLTYKF